MLFADCLHLWVHSPGTMIAGPQRQTPYSQYGWYGWPVHDSVMWRPQAGSPDVRGINLYLSAMDILLDSKIDCHGIGC